MGLVAAYAPVFFVFFFVFCFFVFACIVFFSFFKKIIIVFLCTSIYGKGILILVRIPSVSALAMASASA